MKEAPDCICDPPHPGSSDGRLHYMSCPWNDALGSMCQAHFDRDRALPFYKWQQDACEGCQAAERARREFTQRHHTIDPEQPYGRHISLTCRNHRELRWMTKNIDYIGARSIFFPAAMSGAEECTCPVGDMIVVPAVS